MTVTTQARTGDLAMIHIRVGDADRAMNFFGQLLGWEAERVVFDNHVSHYTANTDITVRILDGETLAPMVPLFVAEDVPAAISAIEAGGGQVTEAETQPDGGGWAMAIDDQGVALGVYRPGGHHGTIVASHPPTGDVGLVFITEDAGRAGRFYSGVLGWDLRRVHPDSNYFDAVSRVGVFDEAAASRTTSRPNARVYFAVPAMEVALARVGSLGGHVRASAQDMGPYYTAICTDDQGTEFGLMSESM